MGMRLHSCSTYKVEFGQSAAFNWMQNEFSELMRTMAEESEGDCEGVWESEDGDSLEIRKTTFTNIISHIKDMSEKDVEGFGFKEYGKDLLVSKLQALYDEADKDNDFVRLCWF